MEQSSDYQYSRVHRALEIAAIAALPVMLGFMILRASHGLDDMSLWVAVQLIGVVFGGYLAADFISGFVHFVGDTYGDEATPVFGPNFIKPFRDHHTDPTGICRHDFVEVNGNNSVVCLPLGLIAYFSLPADTHHVSAILLLSLCSMMVWVFMTNQFHKWAHAANPPAVVRLLQAWNLVLPPGHHDVHHRAPHDKYYCITVGWLNPILYHLRFFEAVRVVVAWFVPKRALRTD
jgi:Lipid desaturase domain